MASAASQHTIHIKRADLASTFVPVQAPAGQQISILRDWYAKGERLDPKTIAFHELLTNEEATAVDEVALDRLLPRKGRKMGFLEKWTKDTLVLAYGDPLAAGAVGGVAPALPPIPESSALLQKILNLSESQETRMARMEALVERKAATKKERMSQVSSRAQRAAMAANNLVLLSVDIPPSSMPPASPRLSSPQLWWPAPFDWQGRSEAQATPDLLQYLQVCTLGVKFLEERGILVVDVRGVPLEYTIERDATGDAELEIYCVDGFSDAAIVDRYAPRGEASDAIPTAIMLIDFKTSKAMKKSMKSWGFPSADDEEEEGEESAADDESLEPGKTPEEPRNRKKEGDLVRRQMIFQMLSFHAMHQRWIPVAATDFVDYVRVWEKQGDVIKEYVGSSGFPPSLKEGTSLIRSLVADGSARNLVDFTKRQAQRDEEDFDDDDTKGKPPVRHPTGASTAQSLPLTSASSVSGGGAASAATLPVSKCGGSCQMNAALAKERLLYNIERIPSLNLMEFVR